MHFSPFDNVRTLYISDAAGHNGMAHGNGHPPDVMKRAYTQTK